MKAKPIKKKTDNIELFVKRFKCEYCNLAGCDNGIFHEIQMIKKFINERNEAIKIQGECFEDGFEAGQRHTFEEIEALKKKGMKKENENKIQRRN